MSTEFDTSLRTLRERAVGPRKSITTYGSEAYTDVEPHLEQFDVEVSHEYLPIPESQGYLTVHGGERFLGSLSAAAFGELREPAIDEPWDAETRSSAYRDLVSLLAGTAFTMDDKRQLVASSREIEDRAWRTSKGTLYADFQALSAFEAQVPVYEHLGEQSDLRTVVYGEPDWEPPALDDVTVHRDRKGDLTDFWVVAFDGAGDPDQKCALIAEESGPGVYTGVLTYEESVVDDLTRYLAGVLDEGGGLSTQ